MIEVLAALSVAGNLANGHDPDTTLQICSVVRALGEASQCSTEQLDDLTFLSLLRYIGCTAFSPEEARATGGDDIEFRHRFASVDAQSTTEVLSATIDLALTRGLAAGFSSSLQFLLGGRGFYRRFVTANCQSAVFLARALKMRSGVVEGLAHLHERWDGKGEPEGLKGEAISFYSRVLQVAGGAAIASQAGGEPSATAFLKKGKGKFLDPALCQALLGSRALRRMNEPGYRDESKRITVSMPWTISMDEIGTVFGDFSDLHSVYTAGHSRAVANLCQKASHRLGLTRSEASDLILAAYLHDLGQVTFPAALLARKGALTPGEWEQMRMHPYRSERILMGARRLEKAASIAGRHHERCDGAGYYRGDRRAALSPSSRILAAAEAFQSMTESRSHRKELSLDQAAVQLQKEARAGQWDEDAVRSILESMGKSTAKRSKGPAGLTGREQEILRLLAGGNSNKQIGVALGISHRTVQHHVDHIYTKTGVSTRAAAALFAVQNGLIVPGDTISET